MMTRIGLAFLFITMSALSTFPCSIPTIPPSQFDIQQYVFMGQVSGYVETTELVNRHGTNAEAELYGEFANKTAGIIINVKDTFHTPQGAKETYEVYRFSLGADCGLYGLPVEWMKERYKIGEWVRVVAAKSDHILQPKNTKLERLELKYGGGNSITLLEVDDPSFRDISSIFDYKAYRSDLIGDPYFELLKDLRRLSVSNETEGRQILDRLTYFPRFCESCGFYLENVFRLYTSNTNEFARYSKLVRERAMTEAEYKRFKESRTTKNQ